LQTLGLIQATTGRDARERLLRLSDSGAKLAAARSPLEAERVGALLQALSTLERDAAVRGLQLLARAAQSLATSFGVST
jgi:DNA-binding MarR family transcriptional regulator